MDREIALKHAIDFDDNLTQPHLAATLRCPLCSGNAAEPAGVRSVAANDPAGWQGSGALTILSYRGGCGHNWEVCIGAHNGLNHIFTRVKEGA